MDYIEVSLDSRSNDETTVQAVELAVAALVAFGHSRDVVISSMELFVDENRQK